MYDRYAQACLSARIDPDTKRDIRLRVDGADWQIGEVGTALRRLTYLPKKTGDGSGETKVPLTWAMITQLSKLMEERGFLWRPDEHLNRWIEAEFMRRHDESSDLKFDVNSLHWTPMPHQLAGAYVGATNRRFFFCDDMRTGKTATALLTMAELEARGYSPFPAMVVCPASVVDSWLEELALRFPDWPATAYRGARRRNLSSRYKVYVMSWNTFRDDMRPAQRPLWDDRGLPVRDAAGRHVTEDDPDDLPALVKFLVPQTLVLDEAHALCNTSTKQSSAAKRMARVAEFAFPMSGTPITRDVGGFWTAMNVLDIRSFPDPDRYKERYCDRYKSEYGQDQIEGLHTVNAQEFHLVLQGSMRRVAKRDVNPDLLPPSYTTRVVQIPPAYRASYDEMAKDMIAHLPDGDEPLEVMSTLAQLQRLTQLASSACDVEIEMVIEERENHPMFGQEVPRYHVTMTEPCWKVDELMAIMDENQGTDNPLLVFSPHTQLVNIAGKRAEAAGYRVGYITGEQSTARKRAYRQAYQAGELDLLCCNVTAGGVGLTLNRGDTVIFLERPWAYWQANQAESRADDVLRAKQVHVIDIVAANTVESRVRLKLKDKARQLSELVRDPRIVEELLGGQPLRVLQGSACGKIFGSGEQCDSRCGCIRSTDDRSRDQSNSPARPHRGRRTA